MEKNDSIVGLNQPVRGVMNLEQVPKVLVDGMFKLTQSSENSDLWTTWSSKNHQTKNNKELLLTLGASESSLEIMEWELDKMLSCRMNSNESRGKRVAVVGAGVSGLHVAGELIESGFDVTVFEKSFEIGGTWHNSIYPGAQCDVQGCLYTYARHQRSFSTPYLAYEQIREYLLNYAKEWEIEDRIQFGQSIRSAEWNENRASWNLEVFDLHSESSVHKDFEVLVIATGQLSKKIRPNFKNLKRYEGIHFHANEWPQNLVIENSCVNLVGIGATGLQIAEELVRRNNQVNLVFRTPAYIMKSPYYRKSFDGTFDILMRNSEAFRIIYRLWKFKESIDGNLQYLARENKTLSDEYAANIRKQMREALGKGSTEFEKLIPYYPLGSKRILLSDGSFFDNLKEKRIVSYQSSEIDFYKNGIETKDGLRVAGDITIFATGFDSSRMFLGFPIKGSKNYLEDEWHVNGTFNPKTYLGISVSGFPNMFMMFGPNTNVVANGSNTYMAECQAAHIRQVLERMEEEDMKRVEVNEHTMNRWQDNVDRLQFRYNWSSQDVPSWYRSKGDKVIANFPGNLLEYWNSAVNTREGSYDYSN